MNRKTTKHIDSKPQKNQSKIIEHCIIACTDYPGETELALQWLEKWRNQLDYVSENEGCGCCVDIWVIRGDEHIIDILPQQFGRTISRPA